MPDRASRARQLREGRGHAAALVDRDVEVVARVGRRIHGNGRCLSRLLPAESRIGQQHDVLGRRHRVDERAIGLGAGHWRTAHVEALAAVVVDKEHVVDDQPRRRAREVVDQHRVHRARPGPATHQRLELAHRLLVDLHHDQLTRCSARIDGLPHQQVVDGPLDRACDWEPGQSQRRHAGDQPERHDHERGIAGSTRLERGPSADGLQGHRQAWPSTRGSVHRALRSWSRARCTRTFTTDKSV